MQAIHRWAFHHAEAQWLWFVWAVNVGVKKILAASGAFAEEAKVVNQIEQLSTGVWSFGDDEADSIDEFLKIASPAFKAASQQPGFEPNLEWRWRALREIGAVPPRFGDVLGPGTPVLEPEEAGFGSVKRRSLRQQRKGGCWKDKKEKVWLKGWRPPRVDGQRAGEDDEELRYYDEYPPRGGLRHQHRHRFGDRREDCDGDCGAVGLSRPVPCRLSASVVCGGLLGATLAWHAARAGG